jgi:hypothetical protein
MELLFLVKISCTLAEIRIGCDIVGPRRGWTELLTGLLSCVGWIRTDVSGIPIGPIFKGQAVQEEQLNL